VEKLGEGSNEKSRDCDKKRADTTPATRRRYRGYPVAMDATGKRIDKDNTLFPHRFYSIKGDSNVFSTASGCVLLEKLKFSFVPEKVGKSSIEFLKLTEGTYFTI